MKPISAARIKAHKHFDLLWQFGAMTRSEAYSWLARTMGVLKSSCHIKNFDEQQCEEVIQLTKRYVADALIKEANKDG